MCRREDNFVRGMWLSASACEGCKQKVSSSVLGISRQNRGNGLSETLESHYQSELIIVIGMAPCLIQQKAAYSAQMVALFVMRRLVLKRFVMLRIQCEGRFPDHWNNLLVPVSMRPWGNTNTLQENFSCTPACYWERMEFIPSVRTGPAQGSILLILHLPSLWVTMGKMPPVL